MIKNCLFILFSCLSMCLTGSESVNPTILYKITTVELWQASQNGDMLTLDGMDEEFIHFSEEEGVERIIDKFFQDYPQVVVLKLDTTKLSGNLVYESNPGGSRRYYHLYNGNIPMAAVIESKLVPTR